MCDSTPEGLRGLVTLGLVSCTTRPSSGAFFLGGRPSSLGFCRRGDPDGAPRPWSLPLALSPATRVLKHCSSPSGPLTVLSSLVPSPVRSGSLLEPITTNVLCFRDTSPDTFGESEGGSRSRTWRLRRLSVSRYRLLWSRSAPSGVSPETSRPA